MQFFGGSSGERLSDPERHILISIGWKPIGGISALLIGAKDAARKMEANIQKAMLTTKQNIDTEKKEKPI